MTHIQEVAVRAVTEQVINMLENSIVFDNGTESFEGWCEDGDIFAEHPTYQEECIKLMREVAPIVDQLTFNYLNYGY